MKLWWMGRYYAPEGEDGGGGAAAGAENADVAAGADAGGEQGAGAEKPADMLGAIDQALGYAKKPDDVADGTAGAQTAEQKAADAKAADEAAAKERDAKAAAGDADAIKAKAEAEGKAKPKDLDALAPTPAEKKAWKPETAQRFEEIRTIAKTERAAREAAEAQIKPLAESREAILSILKETNTTDQDLAGLLEFNRLLKSSDPASLEQALKVVEGQRVRLLKTLGREGDGHDPLAEFPDLQQEVADAKITKERALELVANRKREALAASERQRGEHQQQSAQQVQKARDDGIGAIETWCVDAAKKDIDFKAKEAILLPQVEGIIRDYPPDLWLPTIKTVYAAIVVQKQPAALPNAGDQNRPLRPSGAKPGGAVPQSMAEAIDQGLGYAKG